MPIVTMVLEQTHVVAMGNVMRFAAIASEDVVRLEQMKRKTE